MNTPLILFVGMPESGKTMAVYSLAEHLTILKEHYDISPDFSFLPHDTAYADKCTKFQAVYDKNKPMMGKNGPRYAFPKTMGDVYLKINVKQAGKTLYDILEVPGEKFFDPNNIAAGISPDILNLINPNAFGRGKIVFILLLDLYTRQWDNDKTRMNDPIFQHYVNRLIDIMKNFKDGDKVITLLNQFDKSLNPTNDWEKWEGAYSGLFEALSVGRKYIIFDKIKVKKLPYSCGRDFNQKIDPKTNTVEKDKFGDEIVTFKSDKKTMDYARNLWTEITRRFTWI